LFIVYLYSVLPLVNQLLLSGGRCCRDHMIVGLTTTRVISAYHH